MNIQPINERIILKKVEELKEEKTGSLILPSSAQKQDRFEVVKAPKQGDIWGHYACEVEWTNLVGKIVYIDKYKGIPVMHNNIDYLIIELKDVVAYEE